MDNTLFSITIMGNKVIILKNNNNKTEVFNSIDPDDDIINYFCREYKLEILNKYLNIKIYKSNIIGFNLVRISYQNSERNTKNKLTEKLIYLSHINCKIILSILS